MTKILSLLALITSAAASELPVAHHTLVPIDLGSKRYELFAFEVEADASRRQVLYAPLLLFVEEPSRYGVYHKIQWSRGAGHDRNTLQLVALRSTETVERQIRSHLGLDEEVELMPLPIDSIDVKIEVPGTREWVPSSLAHDVVDAHLFGDAIALEFEMPYATTERVRKALLEPGVRVRMEYRYPSVDIRHNVVRQARDYIFPDGFLDQFFGDKEEIDATEAQLLTLLSVAQKQLTIEGIITEGAEGQALLERLPLFLTEFPSTVVAGKQTYRLKRDDLERVHESILDLTNKTEGFSSVVVYRDTADDRIQAPQALGEVDLDYEPAPFVPERAKTALKTEFSVFDQRIRIARPAPNRIQLEAAAGGEGQFLLALTPRERFYSYAESQGENCVKLFVENTVSNTRATYCVDTSTLALRYERLEVYPLQIEVILTPSELTIQRKGRNFRPKRFVPWEGGTFAKVVSDPDTPSRLLVTYGDGQTSTLEIPL